MTSNRFRSLVVAVAVVSFAGQVCAPAAYAGTIDTATVVAVGERQANLNRVTGVLQQAAVQQQLQELGVDPAAAELRVAALSDAELAQMAEDLDKAPAGGDALALIGAVFLVLLILEVTGVIDIFKKT
jgi:hypothetical protein